MMFRVYVCGKDLQLTLSRVSWAAENFPGEPSYSDRWALDHEDDRFLANSTR